MLYQFPCPDELETKGISPNLPEGLKTKSQSCRQAYDHIPIKTLDTKGSDELQLATLCIQSHSMVKRR